ncbi:LppM family (lipo)protein [Micromonospora palomenae]|uniref:LppM family (lipo)protein n=2 Tax=Micromonospora TaxID=1873 RepID=UPI003F88DB08
MNTRLDRGRAFRLAVCLALVAVLTGCMQLNIGLTVNADDTIDGQLLLTADKRFLTTDNRTVQVGFAELRQNIPTLPKGEERVYENEGFYGSLITYHHTPLKDFTSESVKLVREDDLYRFSLPLDPKKYGGKVAEQDPLNQARFMQLMSFEISLTFPGRVIDTNGTRIGRSVTWKVVANQEKPLELRAVAEAAPKPSPSATAAASPGGDEGGSFPWLLVVGAVVVLLVVGAVVAVLLLRRRGRSAAAPAAAPTGAAVAPAATPPAEHPRPV